MNKYIVKYEREMPRSHEKTYSEYEIQAKSLKHAKKLARERMVRFAVATAKIVDIHKAD